MDRIINAAVGVTAVGGGGGLESQRRSAVCLLEPPVLSFRAQWDSSRSELVFSLGGCRSAPAAQVWMDKRWPPPPWSTAEHPPYSRSRSASCLSSEVDEGHSKLIAYAAPATPHTRSNPRSVYFHGLKQWSPTFLRPLTSPWWKARSTYWSLERKRQPKLYFQLDAFYFG